MAFAQRKPPATTTAPAETEQKKELDRRKDQRRRFQEAELITAKPSSFIFNLGQTPKIVWRNMDEVRQLGFTGPLKIRWFDAKLNEKPQPDAPGRWAALIEGTAPNGTPFRRVDDLLLPAAGLSLHLAAGGRTQAPAATRADRGRDLEGT